MKQQQKILWGSLAGTVQFQVQRIRISRTCSKASVQIYHRETRVSRSQGQLKWTGCIVGTTFPRKNQENETLIWGDVTPMLTAPPGRKERESRRRVPAGGHAVDTQAASLLLTGLTPARRRRRCGWRARTHHSLRCFVGAARRLRVVALHSTQRCVSRF